ncbi:hypothetical protein LP416_11480 [Polaromonas sp. P2-4]|nr:hypothetical protein LP416_11480 [Polaromonas sp. P2-4]
MALQPDILQSCLQEAAKAARPALERCIENAVAALQIAEAQSLQMAERDELSTAWRELLTNKPAWSAQYPADLFTAFTSGVAAAQAPLYLAGFIDAGTGGRVNPCVCVARQLFTGGRCRGVPGDRIITAAAANFAARGTAPG